MLIYRGDHLLTFEMVLAAHRGRARKYDTVTPQLIDALQLGHAELWGSSVRDENEGKTHGR
jgi:hypothetical protein